MLMIADEGQVAPFVLAVEEIIGKGGRLCFADPRANQRLFEMSVHPQAAGIPSGGHCSPARFQTSTHRAKALSCIVDWVIVSISNQP